MTDPTPVDPGNTEFVLPIICPNCKHELEMAMAFALLPPKAEKIDDGIDENVSEEEAT